MQLRILKIYNKVNVTYSYIFSLTILYFYENW